MTPADMSGGFGNGGGGESDAHGDDAHAGLGQPEAAIGPPDMEGCGLANEGRAWAPYGGVEPRWLLLGFRTPVYATRVAVYESGVYGSVEAITLIDEAGGSHVVLDFEGFAVEPAAAGRWTLATLEAAAAAHGATVVHSN